MYHPHLIPVDLVGCHLHTCHFRCLDHLFRIRSGRIGTLSFHSVHHLGNGSCPSLAGYTGHADDPTESSFAEWNPGDWYPCIRADSWLYPGETDVSCSKTDTLHPLVGGNRIWHRDVEYFSVLNEVVKQ